MIARMTAVIAVASIALQPAFALGVTSAAQFGPPTVRLEASDTLYATRRALVQIPRGQTELALPLADLGIAAGDVVIGVQPDDAVRFVGVHTGPEGSRWILEAARDVEATVALTYPVKGLTWAIEYAATLSPTGAVDLDASLRLTNGADRDLEDARVVGEFARATLSLDAGQSITIEQPWLSAQISADDVTRSLVYDKARYGDSAAEVLTISGEAPQRTTALAPGTMRIYAAPESGGEFIRQASLPYVPPREPVEFSLGPASGVTVTAKLDDSTEVDKRLDARNKVALFDLQEDWLLTVRNLREEQVEVAIYQHHEGAWTLEACSEAVERPDAETLSFVVPVAPGEEREVTYRIRHENRQP